MIEVNSTTLLAIGGWVLNLLAIPTILNYKAEVPQTQSIPTSAVLLIFFTYPYLLKGYYSPAISTMIGGILWGFIALRRGPDESIEEQIRIMFEPFKKLVPNTV